MIRLNVRSVLLSLALAIPVVTAASVAFAGEREHAVETTPTTTDARFQRYILSPTGRVTGLLLADGAAVRMRGEAFSESAPALTPGTLLHIEGAAVQGKAGTVITRALVTSMRGVVADGRNLPPHERHERAAGEEKRAALPPMTAAGKIAAIVGNGRGRESVLVLEDGTSVSARGLGKLGLKVGDSVTAFGKGGSYAKGKAMHAASITTADGVVHEVHGHRRNHVPA